MIIRRLWRQRIAIAAVCAVATVGTAIPGAVADDNVTTLDEPATERTAAKPGWITNKSPMKDLSAGTWAEFVGPTQDPWRPTGKVLAYTGFEPGRDGFFFFNYSNVGSSLPNRMNKYVFGGNYSNVKNLGSQQMINLFGRRNVCAGHKKGKSNSCVLTLGAKAWMESVNRVSSGGHCFGIATNAAQLFNRQLSQAQFGGRSTTHSIPFKPASTRPIAQAFSLQTLATSPTLQPRSAVKLLKRNLRPGHVPFTLSMRASGGGGHAVTPIALSKTGKGTYDISIYDNNYPGRVRAIHANTNYVPGTKKQVGYDYELFSLPGRPPEKLVGSINLWDVTKLSGKFACPFCAGAKKTTVHLQPVVTETPVKVTLRSPSGKKIKGLRTIAPSNPWLPGTPQPLPSFQVPRGKAFKVVIDNGANTQPAKTTLTATTGELTWELGYYQLPAGSVDSISITPKSGKLTFATSQGSSPALAMVDHSTMFNPREILVGPNEMNPGATFTTKTNMRRGTFTFTPGPGASAGGAIQLAQQRNDGGLVKLASSGEPLPLNVPVGSHLAWDYLKWKVSAPRVKLDVVGPTGAAVGQWIPLQTATE